MPTIGMTWKKTTLCLVNQYITIEEATFITGPQTCFGLSIVLLIAAKNKSGQFAIQLESSAMPFPQEIIECDKTTPNDHISAKKDNWLRRHF